jgi:predicted nuclease of restriction endonuclease-like (RecB) superfamily
MICDRIPVKKRSWIMARKKSGKKDTSAPRGELVPRSGTGLPPGYAELLEDLKTRVRTAQLKAAVAVNREMIQLYWDIGRLIVERQECEGWGKGVVDRLAKDVQKAFPGLAGFSPLNVTRMRMFYLAYTKGLANLSQPVTDLDGQSLPCSMAEIPWGHNLVLLFKLKDPLQRLWYARQTVQHGWSRAVLELQIQSGLSNRQGKVISNFAATLPPPQSDLAQQTLKDPYVFDFLTLSEEAQERDLEGGLVGHVQKFLLELGAGFAFVGRQVHVEVGDDDFYIDLLFYHLRLRCFVLIDLTMKKFTPEDAGQMNFYLSAVDDLMRHPDDTEHRSDPVPDAEPDRRRVRAARRGQADWGGRMADAAGAIAAGTSARKFADRGRTRSGIGEGTAWRTVGRPRQHLPRRPAVLSKPAPGAGGQPCQMVG